MFVDVAEIAGVIGRLVVGGEEKNHILEANTGGACLFDYDGDGDQDIFLTNGSRRSGFAPGREPRAFVYRNDGDWRFTDVSAATGANVHAWGMGCSAVDYDGDGWLDLYLTNFGSNALLRNNGDGTFSDVAEESGVSGDAWSTGAAFADYDADGDLDLYVASYVDLTESEGQVEVPPLGPCTWRGLEVFCGPDGLTPASDVLYLNDGPEEGFSFSEMGEAWGIRETGPYFGLGVLALDFDDDGDPDIYVANDSQPNFLLRNHGQGHRRRLIDVAVEAGVAHSADGRNQAGMGVASSDCDGDGDLDLLVTNFSHDYNALYRNQGDGTFLESSFGSGIGAASMGVLGWSAGFLDYDNDGDDDLFVANGHVYPQVGMGEGVGTRYAQRNQLFENLGAGRFVDLSQRSGTGLRVRKSSRGAAFGDLDDDGDIDILVANIDVTPALLRNDGGNRGRHLTVQLLDPTGLNRFAVGARVRVRMGNRFQVREIRSGTGYLSQDDLRLHFGLGDAAAAEELTVRWPGGEEESFGDVAGGRQVVITRGRGITESGMGGGAGALTGGGVATGSRRGR